MNRKTILIGLGVLTLLLTVGIAAAGFDEEIEDLLPGKRGEMEGKRGGERGEFGMMHGMQGPRETGDLDNDSIPNSEDPDDDGDGINDTDDEFPHDQQKGQYTQPD